jgi:hypothetical protein
MGKFHVVMQSGGAVINLPKFLTTLLSALSHGLFRLHVPSPSTYDTQGCVCVVLNYNIPQTDSV